MSLILLAALLAAPDPIAPPNPVDPYVQVTVQSGGPGDALGVANRLRRLGSLERAASVYRGILAQTPHNIPAGEGLRRTLSRALRADLLPPVLEQLTRAYLKSGDRKSARARYEELALLGANENTLKELKRDLEGTTKRNRKTSSSWGARARSFLGLLVMIGLAYAFSLNRKRVVWRTVLWGVGLQISFGVLILWTTPGRVLFDGARVFVNRILSFADEGSKFMVGALHKGIPTGPNASTAQYIDSTTGDLVDFGVIFIFHVLPIIIFFSALMSVLYHLHVIQWLVRGIAWVMQRTMKTSGPESLSAAANIFVGQTESPLVIKPYIATMSRSELMAVMTGGFATVAGSVLAAFVRFGIDPGHLLAASVMSAPASLALAKIMVPAEEDADVATDADENPAEAEGYSNVVEAAATGAADGMKLALNVAAMLLAFISLVALLDWVLSGAGLSLRMIFGTLFYPLAWCMGVDIPDLTDFGMLLGSKITINEFVAYVQLQDLQNTFSERSFVLATYALCGFANFSSIGIQIGGISGIAPNRRSDLAKLGLRAMFAGAFASWMTACVAGMLIP